MGIETVADQMSRNLRVLSPSDRDRRAAEEEAKLRGKSPVPANPAYPAIKRAAEMLKMWIVARQTNPSSFQYFGRAGFIAKPISCKPKTAEQDGWVVSPDGNRVGSSCAGLVVDPTVIQSAFASEQKRQKALKAWADAAPMLKTHSYEVDLQPGSKRRGCLMRHGCYIYGDVDLFDVIRPSKPTGDKIDKQKLEGFENAVTEDVATAARQINLLLGYDLVGHGAQVHYGGFDEGDKLDVFPPEPMSGCFVLPTTWLARKWYAIRWPGRVPLSVLKGAERRDWVFTDPQPFT